MTEPSSPSNPVLAERFAALVALAAAPSSTVIEQREAAKGVIDAAKKGTAIISWSAAEGLRGDGAPLDAPLLAQRFEAYGIEEISVTAQAALADLMDLVRLLSSVPSGDEAAARFAGRAAAIDPKGFPRRLKPKAVVAPPAAAAAAETKAATPAAAPGVPDAPERLTQALAVPEPSNPAIAGAVTLLRDATDLTNLQAALDAMVLATDLAFRTGRGDDLIESLAALVAIEFEALERDSSDDRRSAFNAALGRLTKRPMMLRQIAVLRHQRSGDPVAVARLQAILHRYGTSGAEALVDEYVSATSTEARATCLEALRALSRTYDALLALARDTRDLVVRQAAAILGELRDARGEEILIELLHHPDARARRSAVAALARSESTAALEAIGFALQDESPLVRQRAVSALAGRREPRVLALLAPLIEKEPDREVLYAAIGAVGSVGSPEAVQLLMRIAHGEGENSQRRSAGMRVQGCIALVAIRTPASMAAVQGLREDRDGEVREAAVRLVAQAQRRTTSTGIPVVPSV